MARPPKLKRGRHPLNFHAGHVQYLLIGVSTSGRPFYSDASEQSAWQKMGPYLLRDWVDINPGRRPFAWWRWSAPERRRRTDGGVHPHDNEQRQQYIEAEGLDAPHCCRLYMGCPAIVLGWDYPTWDDAEARYESEAAYLDRLGLLTEAERLSPTVAVEIAALAADPKASASPASVHV